MTKITMDAIFEARKIITQVTDDLMRSTSYEADSHEELYELMTGECSRILTEGFLDSKYAPMEYNTIRNELGKVLWNLFEKHIETDDAPTCSEGK